MSGESSFEFTKRGEKVIDIKIEARCRLFDSIINLSKYAQL